MGTLGNLFLSIRGFFFMVVANMGCLAVLLNAVKESITN